MHESTRAARGNRGSNSIIPMSVRQSKLSYYDPVVKPSNREIKLNPTVI